MVVKYTMKLIFAINMKEGKKHYLINLEKMKINKLSAICHSAPNREDISCEKFSYNLSSLYQCT